MPLQTYPAQHTLEGAGFHVHRPFPTMQLSAVDPFLLLDQMGPTTYGPGEAKGAPDHPHRGFETVTYLLEGEFEHRDSHGHQGLLTPGDVQWMTAGSGVVHSEMPSAAFQANGGTLHGIQLWVNLPAADKMMNPRYQEIAAAKIPVVDVDGGTVRVIAGKFGGTEAVIDTRTPITFLHLNLMKGGAASVNVPAQQRAFAYVLRGAVTVSDTAVGAQNVAVLESADVTVEANEDSDVLVIAGKPLGEPVARWGPFVMNTPAEINQAMADYQAGEFGSIPASTGGPWLLVGFADEELLHAKAALETDDVAACSPDIAEENIRSGIGRLILAPTLDSGTKNRLRKLATTVGVPVQVGTDSE